MRLTRLGVCGLIVSALAARCALAAGPADPLLRLVPPEAGATLAVENLRTVSPDFCESPLAAGLKELPAVRAWFASEKYRGLARARAEIEKALDVPITTVRDQLLGDAVVLALQLAPEETPENAHGLILVRFRDRALADRLINQINTSQRDDGQLASVTVRNHRGASYSVRHFQAENKPDEFYAFPDDDILAWSNSEDAIKGAIARQGGEPGLADQPRFRSVRGRLPEQAVASLFLSPDYLGKVLSQDKRPKKPGEQQVAALLARNLQAVQFAGLALEWRDGQILLHTEEMIDASRLDESLRGWPQKPGSTASLVAQVPASALLIAAGHLDLAAMAAEILLLPPRSDRARVDNLLTLFRGLLMGKDLNADVLPKLGPGVVAYVNLPEPDAPRPVRLPIVVATPVADATTGAAIDNALRSLLAAHALDPKHKTGQARVETSEERGVRYTTLGMPNPPFVYAADHDRLIVGNSAHAVIDFATSPSATSTAPRSRFERFRAEYFPDADSFAFADLPRIYDLLDAHRPAVARRLAARHKQPEADARRDLDQALALIRLFEGAYVTSAIAPDFSHVHHTLSLVARPSPSRASAR
jgi:uncharacterized protein DUF3352